MKLSERKKIAGRYFDCYKRKCLVPFSGNGIKICMRIGLKINSLSLAIREKQIEHSEGGAGSTKEWYVKRKYALAINQRMLPFINILIKQRRRSERSIGDLFMDQARLILPQNDFENILENARLIKTEGK
ncbi:MAG: hypothetical protein Pg6C_00640 [Treponemataceae bacterium]|nr:MAG: hypothetical protein Pg6C_00640 [Treponemataceae bacterium]